MQSVRTWGDEWRWPIRYGFSSLLQEYRSSSSRSGSGAFWRTTSTFASITGSQNSTTTGRKILSTAASPHTSRLSPLSRTPTTPTSSPPRRRGRMIDSRSRSTTAAPFAIPSSALLSSGAKIVTNHSSSACAAAIGGASSDHTSTTSNPPRRRFIIAEISAFFQDQEIDNGGLTLFRIQRL